MNSPSPAKVSPSARARVKVLLPLPLGDAYDYGVPEGLALAPGDFVSVPLGARMAIGVVWATIAPGAPGGVSLDRLKDVAGRLDALPLPEGNRRLVDWMAAYTLAPPGAVLRLSLIHI